MPEEVTEVDENELSEDINDWQQNLNNSWGRFLDSFLTLHHREGGVVAPFLDEQERHLVNQRIKLYITQAQDALLSKQASIYFSTLSEAKRLVDEYFKKDDNATQMVLKSIANLEKESLNFSPKVTLQSTQQVKEWVQ